MRYTMTFLEEDFEYLRRHLLRSANEEAAYLAVRAVRTENEVSLLVRQVVPVTQDEIESQSPVHLLISSPSYVRAVKRFRMDGHGFVFIHSHPGGPRDFSEKDNKEELLLFNFVEGRSPDHVHGSIVAATSATEFIGRVWLPDGTTAPIDVIRVVGNRWRFYFHDVDDPAIEDYFERQVRAFGSGVRLVPACSDSSNACT
jgi:proteasome lid subunit RPN8/RPN11